MADFLILRLKGVMQAWGGHTFEDHRPTELFPTRSGLVGLLGACLGIDRLDAERQRALGASFVYAARSDARSVDRRALVPRKITDYHTVLGARRVSGKASENPIQSWREYLCDAQFTVALGFEDGAAFGLERVRDALLRPTYTPFLGRRSCPPSEPIFHSAVQARGLVEALATIEPGAGTVYSELELDGAHTLRVRDVPVGGDTRQFVTRTVYVDHREGGADVSQ